MTDPRGLFHKFDVRRTDGKDGPGGKHEHCRYFVLDLFCDPHALPALEAYAESCAEERPRLAHDLRRLVTRLRNPVEEPTSEEGAR